MVVLYLLTAVLFSAGGAVKVNEQEITSWDSWCNAVSRNAKTIDLQPIKNPRFKISSGFTEYT